MMGEIILISLSVSIFTQAVSQVTDEGHIFEFFRTWIHSKVKSGFLRKPLIDCPSCMVSTWGVLFLAGIHLAGISPITEDNLLYLPLIIILAVGINRVI